MSLACTTSCFEFSLTINHKIGGVYFELGTMTGMKGIMTSPRRCGDSRMKICLMDPEKGKGRKKKKKSKPILSHIFFSPKIRPH